MVGRLSFVVFVMCLLSGCSRSSRDSMRVSVSSVRIVDFGQYSVRVTDHRTKAVNTASGELKSIADNERLIAQTTNIPARTGTSFGFRFVPEGHPAGMVVPLVFRAVHPPMKAPHSSVTVHEEVFQWRCRIGDQWRFIYGIEEEWEAVPGEWILQLWDADRLVAEKRFMLHCQEESTDEESRPTTPSW